MRRGIKLTGCATKSGGKLFTPSGGTRSGKLIKATGELADKSAERQLSIDPSLLSVLLCIISDKCPSETLGDLVADTVTDLDKVKYNPLIVFARVIEASARGIGEDEMFVELRISKGMYDRWKEEHPEFKALVDECSHVAKAYWVRSGRVNMQNKFFNASLYQFIMQNKFGWARRLDAPGLIQMNSMTHTTNNTTNNFDVKAVLANMSDRELQALDDIQNKIQKRLSNSDKEDRHDRTA